MRKKWSRRAYVDLFAGPGKCIDRETGKVFLGSPLIALTTRHPFTDYFFADCDQMKIEALRKRCGASPCGDRVQASVGDANIVVQDVVRQLQGVQSLNLAFLDPYGLELRWNTVSQLAAISRMDLIIHYPQMGLTRSMPLAVDKPGVSDADQFFGGMEWRKIYQAYRRREQGFIHRQLMDHYKRKLSDLGYQETFRDDEVGLEPLMVSERLVPLYRLLFASKHPLGMKFWREVTTRNARGQKRLL